MAATGPSRGDVSPLCPAGGGRRSAAAAGSPRLGGGRSSPAAAGSTMAASGGMKRGQLGWCGGGGPWGGRRYRGSAAAAGRRPGRRVGLPSAAPAVSVGRRDLSPAGGSRRRLRPLQSPATTIFSLSFPTLSSSLCRLGISSRGDRSGHPPPPIFSSFLSVALLFAPGAPLSALVVWW